VLLEAELGVGVNAARELDQLGGARIHGAIDRSRMLGRERHPGRSLR
jgi:hypothetical protein